jgi:hypothetical protein
MEESRMNVEAHESEPANSISTSDKKQVQLDLWSTSNITRIPSGMSFILKVSEAK